MAPSEGGKGNGAMPSEGGISGHSLPRSLPFHFNNVDEFGKPACLSQFWSVVSFAG
ncbi:hypothetical protein COLO4_23560 [Corchorus olitorius]|uniref:Uncharacterized protein n=1 Tax=Corchorus olitorius TaxID=93759 RepID=A0A1R3IFY6_9ROSI|nr:hypothetical protein COLO4_23560 [Corchorus olitorius]